MRRTTWAVAVVTLVSSTAVLGGARRGRLSLVVEDVELAKVLEQLAAQGGPRLTADPEAAKLPITFAIHNASKGMAARWLCRACRLVAVKQGRAVVVGRPPLAEATMKEYKVARLAPTRMHAEALVAFLRRVVLGAYQNRLADEGGALKPDLEVTCAQGRLKVLAPPMVQREVVALLRTIVRAKKPMSYQELRVPYQPYELGFLGARGSMPPKVRGDVSLDLADATADKAAWSLTKASEANFFVDPWDEGLRQTKLSLEAEKLPVGLAAERVTKQLGVDRVFYDGATVFVRPARKPIFESLVVRVYNVSGNLFGMSIADEATKRAKGLKLPPNLPYGVERVGDKLLAAAPGELHRHLEGIMKLATGAGRLPAGLRPPGR